jgi:hypothetical protein
VAQIGSGYNREKMIPARRLVALLCLAVVLCAALLPGASGLFCAVLVPLLLFVAAVIVFSKRREIADSAPQHFPFLSALAPRAPPVS